MGSGRARRAAGSSGDTSAAASLVRRRLLAPAGRASLAGCRPGDVVDVCVYVVVLNLAVEYLPPVISEGFTLSLLTAVLLKVSLKLVLVVKNTVLDRLRAATTRRGKAVGALSLWVVAAGSKLVVLELVDLVFGDSVSLGGFVPVTLLVTTLLLSRAGVRRLLGDTTETA